MRRQAFADLIGVSKQQVSKYVGAGAVVIDAGGDVDVEASLALLEGRLDEEKRQRAIAVYAGSEASEAAAPRTGAAAGPAATVRMTAKAEKDAVERDLKLLEYGRQAAELVSVRDVEAECEQAIAEMREAFAGGRRELAAKICTDFGLAPEKAIPLQRAMTAGFERCLGIFAQRMSTVGDPETANAVQPEDAAAAV